MARMLDCPVNAFGEDEKEQPGYRRYFCYPLIGAPLSTEDAGVGTIRTLAVLRVTASQTARLLPPRWSG